MEVKGVVLVEDVRSPTGLTGSDWPAATQHVANRPIAHHVLDVLESVGIEEIVVASSSEVGAEVRKCLAAREREERLRLRYVDQPAPLDFEDGLSLAAPIIGDSPCLVHQAAGLLGETVGSLMDGLRATSPDLVVTVDQGESPRRHLSPATQQMLHLAELHPERAALGMAGVCLFGRGALACASTATWRAGEDTDLTIVAKRIEAAGGGVHVVPVSDWRRYAGNPLDLLELNRIALDRLETDFQPASNNGNRIEGRVSIHELASVQASVLVGPAVIGAGARITDAYIGPYTSIGAGARLEGVEVERSIIASGASITHVGGRLVASVVGRDARIFRDFSLPRALRLQVGEGSVVALC